MTSFPTDGDPASDDALTLEDLIARPRANIRTVGQLVPDVLREAILTGVFAPGEHLRQDELAERIGVSRIPVRSALMQLASEGLVHFQPHRGAVVRTLSTAQLHEVYDLRQLLEVYALRRSIASMTDDRARRLVAAAEVLDHAHDGSDFVDKRVRFYSELYDGTNNPLLLQLVEQLRSSIGPYLRGLRVGAPAGSHLLLAQAAADGDVDKATTMLVEHLHHVRASLIELIGDEAPAD